MTYCVGWKTDNCTYLVADTAITSTQPAKESKTSFGELHAQKDGRYIYEGEIKILRIKDAAMTFSGDSRLGYSIYYSALEAIDVGLSYEEAVRSAIVSNIPLDSKIDINILFAFYEDSRPRLFSFNLTQKWGHSSF